MQSVVSSPSRDISHFLVGSAISEDFRSCLQIQEFLVGFHLCQEPQQLGVGWRCCRCFRLINSFLIGVKFIRLYYLSEQQIWQYILCELVLSNKQTLLTRQMYTAIRKNKINQAIKQGIELESSDSKPAPTSIEPNEDSFYFPTLHPNEGNRNEPAQFKRKVNQVKRQSEQVLGGDSNKKNIPNYQSFFVQNQRKQHKYQNSEGKSNTENISKQSPKDKQPSKMNYHHKIQQFREVLKETLSLIYNKKQVFGFKIDEETQQLRQKFMRKITEVLEHMHTDQQEFFIKDISKKIKVYPFEIKLWLIAYSIAEKVKKFEEYCRVNNKQIKKMDRLAVIRIQMLSYIRKNVHQKRYRILKIVKRVFDALGLTAFKTTEWYDQLIIENRDQLIALGFEDKKIALPSKVQLMGYWDQLKEEVKQPGDIQEPVYKSSNSSSNLTETQPEINFKFISSLFNSRASSKSRVMEVKKIQKERMSNEYERFEPKEFPEDFKKRISAKIDKAIDDFVSKLFKEKANEICVSQKTLIAIYQIYGKKNQSIIVKQQSQFSAKQSLDENQSSITDPNDQKQ